MTIRLEHVTPPTFPPLLEQLIGKVESLESLVGKLLTDKLPSLESKLESMRDLLTSRRKEHYVVEEVADLTGRSPYTVRRWITEGKLHAIRLRDGGPRGKLLIPRADLEQLIAQGLGANIPDSIVE